MTTYEIFENHYLDCLNQTNNNKYEWAANNVFNLTTYDGELDKLFVKKIIEVCKVILKRENFDYIKDETNYIHYILVCQLLDRFNWVEWGTSIRGAWFNDYEDDEPLPILKYGLEDYGVDTIPFTEENLRILIEFIEYDD